MPSVNIKAVDLVKRYGDTTVISGLSLDVQPGEFFTLLGPSGCGKTTLLRMIAGFNTIEAGQIFFDDKCVNDMDPAKRHIGMVFQNYAIFPHLTARKNVEFGLRNMESSRREIQGRRKIAAKADEFLDLVQMGEWSNKYPDRLSGGQQQRIALARALATSPDVLLMDEPLSNLDAKLRIEMREAIRELQKRVGITTVYVTHDQEEAMAVSDRIAVMKDGVVQQVGQPEDLYLHSANAFVANFLGTNNNLPGQIVADNQVPSVEIMDIRFPLADNARGINPGRKVNVSVRPENVVIVGPNDPGLQVTITGRTFLGRDTHYTAELANGATVELVQRSGKDRLLDVDGMVKIGFHPSQLELFDSVSSENLLRGAGLPLSDSKIVDGVRDE